jgi:hypothetical protein
MKSDLQQSAFYENELGQWLPLDGDWQFRLGHNSPTHIPAPAAWEAHIADKITSGPALYRRTFTLPDTWRQTGRTLLEAHAISFAATIRVNSQLAGEHRGMWSPFQLDVTPFLQAGENSIEIEVWKPGERYPWRESLAGFLPDVATTFGGIWQTIGLRHLTAGVHDLQIDADPRGLLRAEGHLTLFYSPTDAGLRGMLELSLAGRPLAQAEVQLTPATATGNLAFSAQHQAEIQPWLCCPSPALYDVTLSLFYRDDGTPCARVTRRTGFRAVRAQGNKLLLNGEPLHLRGVLDWGWDPRGICPAPSREQVLDQIAKARALGFNLIKLCLFVPDETTFAVADEQGMLLWLELPMWLPQVTPAFRELALREYTAILARVHHHPSIAIVSLGCELNTDADAGLLRDLDALARAWLPRTLQTDNSGSAEAYGGVVTSLSDFNDYHFYTDPHFFQPLVDHFTRPCQQPKPWIYGEFCDADTMRDFKPLQPEREPEPWWLAAPVPLQREDLDRMRDHGPRLAAAGVTDGAASLTRIARRQATAVRKFIFEQVRSRNATGGYVITGWIDTPISTSGVVDDFHNLKFPTAEWACFNADCVLLLDRERRRKWVHGGDRPSHLDPFTCWQGDTAELHVALSNGLGDVRAGQLRWALSGGAAELAGSATLRPSSGGELSELVILRLPFPSASAGAPTEFTFHVEADLEFANSAERRIENEWRLWAVPEKDASLQVAQAAGRDRLAANIDAALSAHSNAPAVVWLREPDERFTRAMPFWREAIHVFAPHPLWQRLPHPGYADMRFFSLATDFALDPAQLAALLGPAAQITPLWRRFDARAMTWADYLVQVQLAGRRFFITTLRFRGGLGCQPSTFETNPTGSWLLRHLLQSQPQART